MVQNVVKKLKPLLQKAYEGENAILELLEHISQLKGDNLPPCYVDLLREVSKNTPVVGMIQSQSRIFLASIKSYLDNKVDIFEDKDILDHVNGEVPVLVQIMSDIKEFEKTTFLPEAVIVLFNSILKLYSNVRKLAVQRYVKEEDFNGEEPATDVFPSLPLHSKKKFFKADRMKTMDDEEECNKEYPKAPKMTPGLAHVFCRHGICKGFTTMTTAENPEMFTKFLTRRLPKNVQAQRRVFLYDNACNLHKNALKRDAHEISKFRIFTDRHHWKNHTGCSESYNCDKYDYLKDVNSQICEQKNRSLRKLSSTLAYCGFEHYTTKVKLFFIMNNLEVKNFL